MSKSAAANAPIIELNDSEYALLRDEKTNGTDAGTFTQGAWRTRTLNTKTVDEIGITLSSNAFTLPAGTYQIDAFAPAYLVNDHKLRLRNTTDAVTTIGGTVGRTGPSSVNDTDSGIARVLGQFAITAPKTFEIQHFAQTTKATNGLGRNGAPGDGEIEVYCTVEIIRGKLPPQALPQYALLRGEKTNGSAGGTFTSGAWRTREINTKVVDEIGITLSSDRFTLPAGSYEFTARAQAGFVNAHTARLQNITDATTILRSGGVLDATGSAAASIYHAVIEGKFTIATPKDFELQHRCVTTRASDGFGSQNAFDGEPERYASIVLRKVA